MSATRTAAMPARRLVGRLALVTGASAGIGRATALALASEGAAILATGRREEALTSLAAECAAFGVSVTSMAGDLNDPGFLERLAPALEEADILVNNAGVLTYAPLLELTPAQVSEMFQTNVLSGIHVSQLAGATMARRGKGHIVIMTSLSARNVNRFAGVYAATKHAMSAIAKSLRLELTAQGVKVTEVAPGMVDTNIRAASTHTQVVAGIQARTYAPLSPEDVAEAVVYAVCSSPNCCPDLIELRPARA